MKLFESAAVGYADAILENESKISFSPELKIEVSLLAFFTSDLGIWEQKKMHKTSLNVSPINCLRFSLEPVNSLLMSSFETTCVARLLHVSCGKYCNFLSFAMRECVSKNGSALF